jgi:cytochrome-b5 reductase
MGFFSPDMWRPATLRNRRLVTHDTVLLTFGLPDGRSLGLGVCSPIIMRSGAIAKLDGGHTRNNHVERPYFPIRQPMGSFDLLVKRYNRGLLSNWAHDDLKVGDDVAFQQAPVKSIVRKYEPAATGNSFGFGVGAITMLCGGTCITPFFQAISAILDSPRDKTTITLLYSNKKIEDILLYEELAGLAKQHAARFKLVLIVGER